VQYKFSAVVSSTFAVQTKVGGSDAVETTGITDTAEKTHVHSDITAFSSPLTVSLEAKRTAGTDTGVLDYFHAYLQIGTTSTSQIEVLRITSLKSIIFNFQYVRTQVWTAATDIATFEIRIDDPANEYRFNGTGSIAYKVENAIPETLCIDNFFSMFLKTNLASNPAIVTIVRYRRVWLG